MAFRITSRRLYIGACAAFISIPLSAVLYSIAVNELRLLRLEKYAASFSHPKAARHLGHSAAVGNFAPASNQCAFVAADYWSAPMSKEEILKFYQPYSMDSPEPRVKRFSVHFADELDSLFTAIYNDVFHRAHPEPPQNEILYITLADEGGYFPNLDIRCH